MKINKEILLKEMAQKCLSSSDVSRITGLAPSSISKLIKGESDKIRPKTVGLVAKALEIDIQELVV